ncbi:MAG: hypothetical protein HYY37_00870 [Candidatus Aenigmarchaeota archaeon]|nr:hypothetical protein [Candidatus Aenigmarchaeota archaeon]
MEHGICCLKAAVFKAFKINNNGGVVNGEKEEARWRLLLGSTPAHVYRTR